MKTIHVLVAAFCLLGFTAFAQKEAGDPFVESSAAAKTPVPKVVRMQLEYIEMPKADLTRLLMEDKPVTTDATALRMKVQDKVDKQEADIIDTQLVLSKSGFKAFSESRHEFIYPTEYEPPSLPCGGRTKKTLSETFNSYLGAPTAFETRNLGSILEAEVTAPAGGRLVEFKVLSSFLWHTGNNVWQTWKGEAGAELEIRMPDFYVLEVNTSGVCVSGQYSLLSVVSPKDQKGEVNPDRKVMVFMKCNVLEAK
jgi:hypothetical protein